MDNLENYLAAELARGRAYFRKTEAVERLQLSCDAFRKAASRLKRKGVLASPRRGFYLVLRPEDRAFGAPDPATWIGPFMSFVGADYRISLLRAAAFHGSSHQAAMVFQVISPRQLPKIELGRQRIEFVYQSPESFAEVNRPEWLDDLKTDAGFAKIAGLELTLLDVCRYFHRTSGISGAAQVVHDLGSKADLKILTRAAAHYENSAVRRLGYLLERFGHQRQSTALIPFAQRAKSFKQLDPSAKPLVPELAESDEKNLTWKLEINVATEVDR